MSILKKQFYTQPTTEIAKQLLGKFLCRKINKKLYVGKIIETEAYLGKKDLACHSAKGLTERTKMMFGPAGFAYIYFIYGMYYCFNVVTEEKNNPCAILIRALEPQNEIKKLRNCDINFLISQYSNYLAISSNNKNELNKGFCDKSIYNILNGPAKLCREFQIDKKLNGHDLTIGKKLWIEDGEIIKPSQIKKSRRIGIDYAGIWKDRLLRFYIKDNKFISKK